MGATLTITPSGELDMATAPALEHDVAEAVQGGAERLVLDLRGLDFMDTAGVHLLLRLRERFGARLELRRPVGAADRVVDLCGVADLVGFADRT